MKKKAFTLVELLIVIAIMALIAAISVPSFQSNQANEEAVDAVNTVENVLKDMRLKRLLNRKCNPVSTIPGVIDNGGGLTVNSIWENTAVLFISPDSLSVGCGFAGVYTQYNIEESYSLADFSRVNIEVYLHSEDSDIFTLDGEPALLKMGETINVEGENKILDSLALLIHPSFSTAEITNEDEVYGEYLKFKISVPNSDYNRTVCFYGPTLLTTSSNGGECEQPLNPSS